ncbi:MAG: hypothetical protein ABUT39_16620 [Acidobacteriota bacterium]
MRPHFGLLALLLGSALPVGVRAAGMEDGLNAHWRGGWVVIRPSLASSCDEYYNDNFMAGDRAESSARRRFDPGEVARVERIGVKRGRVDIFLDLAEGVLEERHDGPFTLYDPKECKVQLQVPVPARAEATAVEARLGELFDLHDSRQEAEASPGWNRRRREPFPKNYEQTLAAYESWKAAQVNAAVMARLDSAIEDAARLNDRIRSEPEYLEGFAKGVDRGQDRVQGDCPSLARASFSPDSGDHGKSSDWRRGYEDGQRLAWNLELMRRLKECFMPAPPS